MKQSINFSLVFAEGCEKHGNAVQWNSWFNNFPRIHPSLQAILRPHSSHNSLTLSMTSFGSYSTGTVCSVYFILLRAPFWVCSHICMHALCIFRSHVNQISKNKLLLIILLSYCLYNAITSPHLLMHFYPRSMLTF